MVAILSDNREFIIRAVKEMYTEVAGHPEKEFHFPTGRPACEFVGYPAAELDAESLARLLAAVRGLGCQVVASSLEKGTLETPPGAAVFHVEHGALLPEAAG